jgi:hypothetical protein
MTASKTYRDRNTGLIGVFPESVALTFPYLEEVEDGAKALINPPVSDAAIAGHTAHHQGRKPADEGSKPKEDAE